VTECQLRKITPSEIYHYTALCPITINCVLLSSLPCACRQHHRISPSTSNHEAWEQHDPLELLCEEPAGRLVGNVNLRKNVRPDLTLAAPSAYLCSIVSYSFARSQSSQGNANSRGRAERARCTIAAHLAILGSCDRRCVIIKGWVLHPCMRSKFRLRT
jgi:hypothetical protein